MHFHLKRWSVQLGLFAAVIGSTMAIGNTTLAQVVPDSTLGSDNSAVDSSGNIDTISGGATRGANLFHSFEQFSVQNGRTAQFDNATSIQNILTRVTGSSVSNIDGIIGARGAANLFLLNPNGIIFGQNARLNIGGSFIGTTARSIDFADGTQFSATPGSGAPLLTVNVPIGLQFGTNPGNIVNRASNNGLLVQPGRTLGLVGGNINLAGGNLFSAGGRVELGAVAAPGVIGLNTDNNAFRFSFPADLALADISLSDLAQVDTRAAGGGSIAVNTRNLSLTGGSEIGTGIFRNQGSAGAIAGDIDINAQGAVTIDGVGQFPDGVFSSGIFNNVEEGATGRGGNINIKADSLSLSDRGTISASVFGTGDVGSVNITTGDGISLNNSTIFSRVQSTGRGNGGNINIAARSLSLSNGGRLNTVTQGQGNAGSIQIDTTDSVNVNSEASLDTFSGGSGNAGNVTINAGGLVAFDGENSDISSFFLAGSEFQGEFRAGDIRIKARSLSLTNGVQLFTSTTSGQGNAGNINVDVSDDVSISGGSQLSPFSGGRGNSGNVTIVAGNRISLDNSSVFSVLGSQGVGRGGDVTLRARSLSLANGARISTATLGQGDAGNINVEVSDDVSISRSDLSLFSSGNGNAGNLTIDAGDRIVLDDSVVFSELFSQGVGRGGDISVRARSLFLNNGAQLNTSTAGRGDAGNINIAIEDDVTFTGVNQGTRSGVFSQVYSPGIGNSGDINLSAGTLALNDGAQINAISVGRGDAGDIAVNVSNGIAINGFNQGFPSAIGSSVEGEGAGEGGNVSIDVRNGFLSLTNGGLISTSTLSGQGDAGNIDIEARNLYLDRAGSSRGGIFATSASGNGGNIRLQASRSVRLRNGGVISTSAGGTEQPGNGGNITIDAPLVIANSDGNNDITANAFRGSGGRIEINARSIFGLTPRNRQELQSLLGTDAPTAADFLNALGDSSSNDVAAISLTDPALSGTVRFNAADIDPSRDLVELPTGLVDASGLVAAGCPSGAENRFAVTGRGGLPPAPGNKLSPDAILTDWASLPTAETNRAARESTPEVVKSTSNPPVEATTWQFSSKGEIVLTDSASSTSNGFGATPTFCSGSS